MLFKIRHLLIALIFGSTISHSALGQGLAFNGLDKRINERTTYSVFGNREQRFSDCLSIHFEFMLYPQCKFGYILRIKDSIQNNIFNISLESDKDSTVIRLNNEGHYSIIKATLPADFIKDRRWYKFGLTMNTLKSTATLIIDDREFSASVDFPSHIFKCSIDFGLSDHIIDVPSFAIRNLSIGDYRHTWRFPLDESNQTTIVTDEKCQVKGIARNPIWLISEHYNWTHLSRMSLESNAVCQLDLNTHTVWYFNSDSLKRFDIITGKTEYDNIPKCPMEFNLGMSYIEDGSIICYEPFSLSARSEAPASVRLDMRDIKWEILGSSRLEHPVHHHCGFINPKTDRYTIFGGFGNKKYNGSFFYLDNEWNWKRDTITASSGDIIPPRFFVSSKACGDTLFIYGGMGNESGEQIVGRQYYYDLHMVDLNTGESKLLWSENPLETDNVPVRTLLVEDNRIYTLCYPEYKSKSELTLCSFALKNGESQSMRSSIPIVSDKILTNATLYFDHQLESLFACIMSYRDDRQSTLDIYRLAWPPIMETYEPRSQSKTRLLIAELTVAAIIILAIALLLIFRKFKADKNILLTEGNSSKRRYSSTRQPNSIYLFGDLQILSGRGQDITSSISPQQRLILLLLIEYHETGLSSSRLSKMLWPDKDEKRVKNSRGIAIFKLRNTLSLLNGTTIEYDNGRYRLVLGSECHCDYIEFMRAQKEGRTKDCISILSRGRLACDEDTPLLDSFKDDTDATAISLLEREAANALAKGDYGDCMEICEILRRVDPLSEDALKCSVLALTKTRNKEKAYILYADFRKAYSGFYGSEYPVSFKRLAGKIQ